MNNKFKVGDKIKYLNYNSEYYIDEVDREQIIVIISNFNYYTIFLDNGSCNFFQIDSKYAERCIFIEGNYNFHEYKNGIPEYKNGIPVIWEDEVFC